MGSHWSAGLAGQKVQPPYRQSFTVTLSFLHLLGSLLAVAWAFALAGLTSAAAAEGHAANDPIVVSVLAVVSQQVVIQFHQVFSFRSLHPRVADGTYWIGVSTMTVEVLMLAVDVAFGLRTSRTGLGDLVLNGSILKG
jgi:hypothetical protein